MATDVRNSNPLAATMVAQLKILAERVGAGASFHLDAVSTPITADNATDLATSLTLCKQIVGVYLAHLDSDAAHKIKDPKPSITVASVVSLATAITAANAVKADYNTHRVSTAYHYNADSTNAVSSADATDQSSLNTLLNEIKGDLNAHSASGPAGALAKLVDA